MLGEPGATGLDEGHRLTLVVRGAARDDHGAVTRVVDETGREGRMVPCLERVSRLDVVVPVEQDVPALRTALLRPPMRHDHRLAERRLDARVETNLTQRVSAPFGSRDATVMK